MHIVHCSWRVLHELNVRAGDGRECVHAGCRHPGTYSRVLHGTLLQS